jgi:glycosyltransferase involved in cell wall biosynthesis
MRLSPLHNNRTDQSTAETPIRQIVMIRPETGGVAYVARSCATELRARGVTVTELTGGDRGWPAREGLRQVWARRSWIRSADIVHVELGATALSTFWLALWASVLRGDLVTVSHDGPLLVGSPGSGVTVTGPGIRDAIAHKVFARFLDRPLRALLRRRTMVWVTLSRESARQFHAAAYSPVVTVALGADAPTADRLPSQCDTLVYAGYIAPAKGLDRLVVACEKLGWSTGLRLQIVGEPGSGDHCYATNLRHRLERSGTPFSWEGWVDDSAFNAIIARAAVVVIPYRRSNPVSGIVVRAAVEGRPIIGTPVPAITGPMAEGLPCVRVEDGGPEGLAKAIAELASDEGCRDELGRAAARWGATHCTWALHVDGLEAAYSHVTGAWRGPEVREKHLGIACD